MNKANEYNLIRELGKLGPTPKEEASMLHGLSQYTLAGNKNRRSVLSPYRKDIIQKHLSRVAVLALILSFSGSGVGFAAADSLPGDFLYPVKRTVQKIEISLVADDAKRIEKTTELVEEKVQEVQKLIEKGEFSAETQKSVSRDIAELSESIVETTAEIREENPIEAIKVATKAETEIAESHSKLLAKDTIEAQSIASVIETSAEEINSANNETKQAVLSESMSVASGQDIDLATTPEETPTQGNAPDSSADIMVLPEELSLLESEAVKSLERFGNLFENPLVTENEAPFYIEVSNSYASMQQLYQAAQDALTSENTSAAFVYLQEIISHTEKAFIYLDEALSISNSTNPASNTVEQSDGSANEEQAIITDMESEDSVTDPLDDELIDVATVDENQSTEVEPEVAEENQDDLTLDQNLTETNEKEVDSPLDDTTSDAVDQVILDEESSDTNQSETTLEAESAQEAESEDQNLS